MLEAGRDLRLEQEATLAGTVIRPAVLESFESDSAVKFRVSGRKDLTQAAGMRLETHIAASVNGRLG